MKNEKDRNKAKEKERKVVKHDILEVKTGSSLYNKHSTTLRLNTITTYELWDV